MFRSVLAGLVAASGLSGLLGMRLAALPPAEAYRTVRPVTSKNIGRNLYKTGRGKYLPHQGAREIARRRRQMAAGQLVFIKHGPRS